jgi:hypothetical protein
MPLPADYLAPGVPVLGFDEFLALPEEAQEAYVAAVEELEQLWRLQPHQAWADKLANIMDEVLYGGAVGGGKSELMIYRAHHLSLAIPNHRTLILRSTFPELRRSLILRSIMRIPTSAATYKVGDREWHYPNGAVIEFGHCDSDEDAAIYLSAEYQSVMIDEATLFTPLQVTLIASRLRATKELTAAGARPHLFCGTNPGGPGHSYFKRRYVDATDKGRAIAIWDTSADPDDPSVRPVDLVPLPPRPTGPHDWDAVARLEDELHRMPALTDDEVAVAFVPSTLADNAYIDKTYRRRINSLPTIERKQAYGDWDVFKGQYWEEWNPNVHIVAPFEIPETWERARGIDYGFAPHPFACVWVAWDENGTAYVYRELVRKRMTPPEQAVEVLRQSVAITPSGVQDERIRLTAADPSTFTYTGHGPPISQQWSKAGLRVQRANNARIDGWANMREYLRVRDPDEAGAPDGDRPWARLYVFNTCTELIRTIPLALHAKNNPEDMDTHGEDDVLDALRYAMAVRPHGKRSIRRRRKGGTLSEIEASHLATLAATGGRRRRGVNGWRTS